MKNFYREKLTVNIFAVDFLTVMFFQPWKTDFENCSNSNRENSYREKLTVNIFAVDCLTMMFFQPWKTDFENCSNSNREIPTVKN